MSNTIVISNIIIRISTHSSDRVTTNDSIQILNQAEFFIIMPFCQLSSRMEIQSPDVQ